MYIIRETNEHLNIFKNSKFISKCFYVTSKEEIEEIILNERRKYKDCTHLTYAFKLQNEQKYSDDKEPLGTAGIPIMNIILKNELVNILIIVIRYFGGTKLGAGGLIRAYGKSASDAIKDLKKEVYISYNYYEIMTSYDNLKLLNSITFDMEVTSKNFGEIITYDVRVPREKDNIEKVFKDYKDFKIEKIPTSH